MTQEFIDKLYAKRDELYDEIEYAEDHNNPYVVQGFRDQIADLDSKIGIAQECLEKGFKWPFKDEYPEGCNESLEDGGAELKPATQWRICYDDGSFSPTDKFYVAVDNAEFSGNIVRIEPIDGDIPCWTVEDGLVDFGNLENYYSPKNTVNFNWPDFTPYDETDLISDTANEELKEDTIKKGNK